MEVIFQDSTTKLQRALVDDLGAYMIENRDKPMLLFYSGGSALDIFPLLFEYLTNLEFVAHDIWFAPIDERFDVTASNYRAFAALGCYRGFEKMGVRFVDVLAHGDLLEDAAYWYNGWVRVEMDRVHVTGGKVVSILGMGPDGHTAGVFPFPEDETFFKGQFIDTNRYVVGYDVGNKNQYRERITVTVPGLKASDRFFAYVSGAGKKDALERVVKKNGSVAVTPVILWNELNDFSLYTDILL